MFMLGIPANVVATVAANQIWTWLQTRAAQKPLKVIVEGQEVPFEEEAVKRLLVERMEADNDNKV